MLGQVLLAEIRTVVHHDSLPLSTRKTPIVVSELGYQGGVIGAAKLVSNEVYRVSR